jgi:hypothetical protein
MNDLDAAIYSKLSADTTLAASAAGGVYRIVAPEGTTGVYIVYQMIGALNDLHTIGTDRRVAVYRYQIKAIERGYSASTAKTAMERVDALLNDGSLSTGGTTLLVCRREAPIPDIVERLDNEEVYQHVGATYLVEVQQ